MGKDTFEFARIGSPEEVADYLSSLAVGLKRGEVTLEAGRRTLRLNPAPNLKLELEVKEKQDRGKVAIEIRWKRELTTRVGDLRVEAAPR